MSHNILGLHVEFLYTSYSKFYTNVVIRRAKKALFLEYKLLINEDKLFVNLLIVYVK